jgi:hypothetical protein
VKGIETTERGSYQGPYKDSMRHGEGVLIMNNGYKYMGEFRNNKKNGNGILFNEKGNVVAKGIWKDDKKVKSTVRE